VERNRFKRWCRESVRTHLHILERPAVGIVLLEKKEPKLSYTMIEGEIKRLYIQAHGRLIPRRKVQ
jgi:ribonuclease P protein component